MGKEPKIETYTNHNGEVVKVTDEVIKAKAEAMIIEQPGSMQLLTKGKDEIAKSLKESDEAITTVVNNMILGRHYLELPNIEGKFLTQDGADFLARVFGIVVEYDIVKDIVDYKQDLVLYEYKAKAYSNGQFIGEGTASANSKEEVHRKVYQELKNKEWVTRDNKTVFDVLNTVQQKAQIRAKKKVIRNILGISAQIGQDPELIDNPTANKHAQMKVYRELYKLYLPLAPEAPKKKKQKNGKWKFFTDKDHLVWRKEWVRVTILQPYLLKEGLPTHKWGIKDLEIIMKALPDLETPETKQLENKKEASNAIKTK